MLRRRRARWRRVDALPHAVAPLGEAAGHAVAARPAPHRAAARPGGVSGPHKLELLGGIVRHAAPEVELAPLAEVPRRLTTEAIVRMIRLSEAALRKMRGKPTVRLTVLGLNPHAGEGGLFGDEEKRLIVPAIQQAKAEGYDVVGPLPPDTAFLNAVRSETDGYICMYHDQGLIPLKTLAFDQAVNVTLGLPIVRTSVDHGTAYDIAWKNRVQFSSMMAAIDLAQQLCGV